MTRARLRQSFERAHTHPAFASLLECTFVLRVQAVPVRKLLLPRQQHPLSVLKHPKFENDPSLRILPPLQRNLCFAVLSLLSWLAVIIACCVALSDAANVTVLSSPGFSSVYSAVEVPVTCLSAVFAVAYLWMFWDAVPVLWKQEEVCAHCVVWGLASEFYRRVPKFWTH
jgi:hypothetical protein